MKGLTPRQQEVLDFIEEYVAAHGFPPSVRNIAAHLSLVSASGVHKHIKALVRKKYLTKQEFTSRSLRVVKRVGTSSGAAEVTTWKVMGLLDEKGIHSVVGRYPATLRIPVALTGRSTPGHALIVDTTSFAVRGIQPGDALLIGKEPAADVGELVVTRRSGVYALSSSADSMGLSSSDRYGVVLGLWRSYRNVSASGHA